MRKPTDGQLAIGGLIVFALWIFVALPLYYGAHNHSAAYKCSFQESQDYSFWEKARCEPVAYFTIWLVGFTGVLAVSTIGLWVATGFGVYNQIKDKNHSARLLAVKPLGVYPMPSDKGKLLGYVAVINAGHLPARNVRTFVDFAPVNAESDRVKDFPLKDALDSNVIAPGIIARSGAARSHAVSEIIKLPKKDLFFHIWGIVYYRVGFWTTAISSLSPLSVKNFQR